MSLAFPLDDATLVMLRAACEINPDSGQTHLHDFLDMGTRVKSETDITDEVYGHEEGDDGVAGAPVYFVEYEEGCAPFSEHCAIIALVDEVLRLREAAGHLARLPYPVSADERMDWLVHQQHLKDVLGG